MGTNNKNTKFVRVTSFPFLTPQAGTFYAEGATTTDVLEFQHEILMFFGGLSAKHERIGMASVEKYSFDGTAWTQWFSIPIVDIGVSGDFDSLHVTDPASVVVNNKIAKSIYITAVLEKVRTPSDYPYPTMGEYSLNLSSARL